MIRHLKRNLPTASWESLTDTRDRRGRRYGLSTLLNALMLGMVTAQQTLEDVIALLRQVPRRRQWALTKIPSETTLWRAPQHLRPEELRAALHRQAKEMHRSKQLGVLPDIGISLVAIDGKVIATDDQRLHPESLDHNRRPDGGPYSVRVLRAVHVGSAVKPILDQHVIPGRQGEANNVIALVESLLEVFGRTNLLECVSFDAGLTSRENCHFIDEHGVGFIAALKGDQPTLHTEAVRLLGEGEAAPTGGWERVQEEVRGSRHVTLHFARTREMVGWHDWRCIRQVWRLRTVRRRGARTEEQDRYFVTNLPWGRLKPEQCLAAIRAHWGIENDSNWTMDTVWMEDKRAWCRQGRALETLSLIRCIAYNIIRLFRCRRLRSANNRTLPYRQILKRIEWALISNHHAAGFG